MIPATKATAIGEVVTYYSRFGGIGRGVLIDGVVLSSGGNGWYYQVPGLERYDRDGGRGYAEAIRRMNGPGPRYVK